MIVTVGGMAGAPPTDASGDASNRTAGEAAPDYVIPTLTLKAVH